MNLPRVATLLLTCALLATGCSTPTRPNAALRDPAMKLTMQAGEYLMLLKKAGQLPGVTPYDRGDLETPTITSKEVSQEHYPISRRFGLIKQGQPDFHYRYTLTKASANTSWRLTGATKWDAANQTEAPLTVR